MTCKPETWLFKWRQAPPVAPNKPTSLPTNQPTNQPQQPQQQQQQQACITSTQAPLNENACKREPTTVCECLFSSFSMALQVKSHFPLGKPWKTCFFGLLRINVSFPVSSSLPLLLHALNPFSEFLPLPIVFLQKYVDVGRLGISLLCWLFINLSSLLLMFPGFPSSLLRSWCDIHDLPWGCRNRL